MKIQAKPQVNGVLPADSAAAQAHFARKLAFETDCWDVHHDISKGIADFVLIDVRSPELYRAGHAMGAINIPHSKITETRMAEYPP